MSDTKKLVNLIRELVKSEVKKELNQILISEGKKAISEKMQSNTFNNSTPLNETKSSGMEEYPTMSGKPYDTNRMTEMLGYGNMMGDAESRRKASAIQTAQSAGVDPNNPAVKDVMDNLTKDYRGVMTALKKKDGKLL
tara:strand:+ start:9042 stop:9455 length:414 start_codon:yes stop_codon:yes gene_type:complete